MQENSMKKWAEICYLLKSILKKKEKNIKKWDMFTTLMEDNNITMEEAMDIVYNSKTFEKSIAIVISKLYNYYKFMK